MKEREVWMGKIMAALELLNERALSMVYYFIVRMIKWNQKRRKKYSCVKRTPMPRRRETVFYCGGRCWSVTLTFDKY